MKHTLSIFFALLLLGDQGTLKAQHKQENAASLSASERLQRDTESLTIPLGYTKNLKWDLQLDSSGANGSVITWKSDNPQYLSNTGKLLKRSPKSGKKVKVKLTAVLAAETARRSKSFDIYIANEEQQLDGYLFAYFEGGGPRDKDEQLRFAASEDAVNWYALNKNEPVLNSAAISGTGGIRDPHILRAEDEKSFLAAATDMSTAKNGWGHNPGIVMLKSADLLSWKHAVIDLEKMYPAAFKNIKWVWAPQIIYDPAAGKYMVYFTVRYNDNEKLDFYAAYAKEDFSGFENEPVLLFSPKYGAIDGDIIYKDGLYHFFYKGNTKDASGKEIKNGIQQATGKSLQGPWTEEFKYLDVYSDKKTGVEGSSVFKLNGVNTYILMYDLYSSKRYEFQRSEDLFHFTDKPESFTKNFSPRHGSVIGITAAEAKRLNEKWGGVPQSLIKKTQEKIK